MTAAAKMTYWKWAPLRAWLPGRMRWHGAVRASTRTWPLSAMTWCPGLKFWDYYLTRAIEDMGGTGFAYPWDGLREDVPEACVMSSDIVTALGWACMPDLEHFFIDDVWADLGLGASCLRHCRAIVVDHVHPRARKAEGDKTYSSAFPKLDSDREAYYTWRRSGRMAEDIRMIQALRERAQEKI